MVQDTQTSEKVAKKILGGKPHGLGTELAEYSEEGPFHCEDCKYLRGVKTKIFEDADGKGRCSQKQMKKDPQVKHDKDGFAIVNIENGCCRFVRPV